MRNKIIIGLLLLSVVSFGAYGYHNGESMWRGNGTMMGRGYGCDGYGSMMWDRNDLSEEHRGEMFEMMRERRETGYKESFKIREKELELERKLSADKVDWKGVERLNKEISNLKAERRLQNIKDRKEIEDKYDGK